MINFYHRSSANNQKMMLYTIVMMMLYILVHNTEGEPSAIASLFTITKLRNIDFVIIIVLY